MSLAAYQRLHPGPPGGLIPGVDVSGWQTPQQLEQTLTWAKFAYIKASEGLSFVEDLAAQHRDVCRRAGVPYGYYHFARPERGDAAREIALFAGAIDRFGGPGALPPVLDLESGAGDLNAYALTFLRGIEQAAGRQPMIYVGPGFAQGKLSHPDLARFPLWLAHYASAGQAAWVPAPWRDWTVWQYQSQTAEHGHLDVNVARPDFLAGTAAVAAADDGFSDDDRAALTALRRVLGG